MTKIIVIGIPSEKRACAKLVTAISLLVASLMMTYGQKLFYDMLYVLAFLTPLIAVDFIRTMRAVKAAKYFFKNCKLLRDFLEFNEEIKVKWGFLEAIGHRTLSGLYSHDAFFIPDSDLSKVKKIKLGDINKDYFIVLSKLGTGAAVIPGFKVWEGKSKGVIVTFLKPQLILFKPNEEDVVLKYGQHIAEAEIKPRISGLEGAVYVYRGEGKCHVELALICTVEVEKHPFRVKVVLAKPKNMLERFNYNCRINETYIVVTYGKNLSPIALVKKIGLKTPLIIGMVKGDVIIELKMRIPLRKILTKKVKINLIKLHALPLTYPYIV
ncbi:MAG: hypothetical protein DRO23_09335 [Thermoprotei archaeon]|nr:MAG: hypothetical protein DRO23_09335 [Thermoprotei archaeon]